MSLRNGRLSQFTDGELWDLASALDAAAGEGQAVDEALAAELATECEKREIMMPLAYGHGLRPPAQWLAEQGR